MLAQVTLDEYGLKQLTPVAGEDGSGGSGTLEDTDFPVGYVYTQFPQQSTPADLGLPGTWTEITSNYAGYFFRAEGGNAAAFGCCQSYDNRTTSWISSCLCGANMCPHSHNVTPIGNSPWVENYCFYIYNASYVPPIWSSNKGTNPMPDYSMPAGTMLQAPIPFYGLCSNGSEHCHYGSISSTASETRPDNYSIRIWKRTA